MILVLVCGSTVRHVNQQCMVSSKSSRFSSHFIAMNHIKTIKVWRKWTLYDELLGIE